VPDYLYDIHSSKTSDTNLILLCSIENNSNVMINVATRATNHHKYSTVESGY